MRPLNKYGQLLPTLLLTSFCLLHSPALAQEVPQPEEESPFLSATLSSEYATRYMWRGFDLFADDEHGVSEELYLQTELGIYFGVWAIQSTDRELRTSDEFDYYIGYTNSLFAEQPYEIALDLSYLYYDYPRISSDYDSQEINTSLKLPRIIPVGESLITPYTGLYYNWSEEPTNQAISWWRVGVAVTPPLPVFSIGEGLVEDQLRLFAETFYVLDGDLSLAREGFSHLVFGACANVLNWGGLSLLPTIYYQESLEDTVNTENELWFTLKLSYSL